MPNNTSNHIDRIIGTNISIKRSELGFTQLTLGEICGVSAQQISKYESGDNQINAARLVQFSKILDCNIADLFAGIRGVSPCRPERADQSMMKAYQGLPDAIQHNIRALVHAINHTTMEEKP